MDALPSDHDSPASVGQPQQDVSGDQRWVAERFIEAWDRPELERFLALLHNDVVLLQPVTPTVRGKDAARQEFSCLLEWLPDLRGEVDGWAIDSAGQLLVHWRLRFTLGHSPFELRIVDRLVIRDRLIIEREAYFDSVRFLVATLTRPSAWAGFLRYRGLLPAS